MVDKNKTLDLNEEITTPKLAIVIPAYKCAGQIAAVLCSIPAFISHIIVIDDASPDALEQEVAKVNDKRLTYIRHEQNRGVGGAMLTGYNKALELGAEIIVKLDGDGQMDASYISLLIVPLLEGQADYAKGNRFLHARELAQMPKRRLIGNIGLTFLTKLASGYWHIFDPNNGFTAIHHYALSLTNQKNIHPRYFFESSLLIELNRIRAVVIDIPIPAHYGAEKSSLSLAQACFEFPFNLGKSLIRRIIWQYFLYDFTPVSLFLILGLALTVFGAVWGLYHWYISITYNLVATTGTVMIGVLPIILGFQLLLEALVLDIQNTPASPVQNRIEQGKLRDARIFPQIEYYLVERDRS
jgi:glycosyltransferase involved in cell wall biosynthesis